MKSKNYFIEVKIGDRDNGSPIMKTWHSANLINFTGFLDNTYPQWWYMNVKDKNTGDFLARFTQSRRPISKHLP